MVVVGIAVWSYRRNQAAWGDAMAALTVVGLLLGIYLGALQLLSVGEPGVTSTQPPAGPTTSTPAPAATPPTATRSQRSSYNVNGDSHNGALSIVLLAGGSVTQQFIAVTPTITWAGVIVGCDPGLTPSCGPDGSSFGPLDIQILDNTRVLATAQVDTVNNGTSEGPLNPPADLTPGRTYVLRVVDSTGKPAGFYFNRNSDPRLDITISGAYHSGDNSANNLDLSALIDNR